MNGKDIVWSKEIKDFAAYCFGYSKVSQQAADYLWNVKNDDVGSVYCNGDYDVQSTADGMMGTKEYKEIVKLLQRMTLYFGHDYVEDFIDIFKNECGVEVTA